MITYQALSIRIVAPIPGKGVVGIEIPNRIREMVFLREIFASEEFHRGKTLRWWTGSPVPQRGPGASLLRERRRPERTLHREGAGHRPSIRAARVCHRRSRAERNLPPHFVEEVQEEGRVQVTG